MQQIIMQLQGALKSKDADRQLKMETTQIKAAADIDKAKIMAQPQMIANTQATITHLHKADIDKAKLALDALVAKSDADLQAAQIAVSATAPARYAESQTKE